jgi:signal transduction histidine kinase
LLDNELVLTISDSGQGIPKENLSRLFDPFFTTKEPGKGTGLGLSISYEIIKGFNGSVEIQSEVKKGTNVIIKLPT